jgi:hypothetical protein
VFLALTGHGAEDQVRTKDDPGPSTDDLTLEVTR